MLKKLELKDYILIGLLSSVYIVVFMVVMMIVSMLGPIGHGLSTAIAAIICGTIIVFMCYKVGKTGIYTLLNLIFMLVITLMGAFYLPWFISTMVSAILADIISTKLSYQKLSSQLISYSFINVGGICGSLIPIWFFVDSYRETWIKSNKMTPEQMDMSINAFAGMAGVGIIVVTIICSCIGIMIGRKILAKHFKENVN